MSDNAIETAARSIVVAAFKNTDLSGHDILSAIDLARAMVNSKSMRQSLVRQYVDDFTRIYNIKRTTGVLSMDAVASQQITMPSAGNGLTK